MIGKTLNHYQLLGLLGRGGMGEVYLAEDARLGRRLALKVLPAELAGDPQSRSRFEREAKAVAALNHPNVVTIHSVEEADGLLFITMELVEGESLADSIPAGGLPSERLFSIACTLTGALGVLHEQGVIHRDLKPANHKLTHDDCSKILYFGRQRWSAFVTGPGQPCR